jgi:predicted GNAT family acetyltransferase
MAGFPRLSRHSKFILPARPIHDNIAAHRIAEPVMSDVRDNPEKHRFELVVDGYTALAEYRLSPGVVTFTHTEVPKELGGRGIGSKLAKGALDQARARGLRVVPLCPFIKAWIEKHPEYRDLLAQ